MNAIIVSPYLLCEETDLCIKFYNKQIIIKQEKTQMPSQMQKIHYKNFDWSIFNGSFMLWWVGLNNFFRNYTVTLDNNPFQISWRYLVKCKSFPYKDLTSIVQFVWQLYVIVIRYRPFQKISSFLVRKRRVQSFRLISKKLRDSLPDRCHRFSLHNMHILCAATYLW